MTKISMSTPLCCGLLLLASSALEAQDSPYLDHQRREIKALSDAEIEQYRQGAGMGFALAAELNGYPGPKHVLELADELALESEQRSVVQAIFDRMHRQAMRLGEEVVRRERELDRAFVSATLDAPGLRRRAGEIARARGELRSVHLTAHLETHAALTSAQRARYADLRGYDAGSERQPHHRHGH